MDEVEELAVFNAFEQGRVFCFCDLVPAHVRHLEAWGVLEPYYPALYDAKALVHPELVRLFEQELQAQTDAEEGLAALDGFENGRDEPVLFEVPHAVAERADAGQDDVARVRYYLGVACYDRLASD